MGWLGSGRERFDVFDNGQYVTARNVVQLNQASLGDFVGLPFQANGPAMTEEKVSRS